ncbi:hypothetical protein FRC17_007008 [Serendipita sp. 399]|nr:hypothetical protein FRC17_007008 [Serendipita sp. 399]
MEQDRYHEVEPLVREELAISHELNGEQSEKTAEILGRLATVVLSLGRIAEAEALRSEQYATRRKLLGDDDPDTIQALHQLTALFLTQERYAEAEALCKKELAVRPSPSEDDTSLVVLGCLSRCLYEQEKYEEAERYEREAIAASRMLYGDHHPKTLPYLRNLVLSVFCQDRYDESEALWLEIHALNEENYGPDGEATLESLHWLARSTYLQGRYAEAGELFSKELELWKDKGETRAESLKCLSWLARSLSKQQEQVGKAEALWKEEITAIRQGADGCDKEMLCTALHWYASFLAGDGRRQDEAIAVMREELELTRELEQVVEHPMKTLKVLEYLADFLFDEERYAEAVSVWEEVVSVSQAVYDSSTHALTLRARDCLARSKLEIKCYSEAEAIWRRCLSDMPENQHHVEEEEGSPSAKRRRLDFCHWLALSVFYQDRFDEAEALWREELAGRQAKSTQEEDEDKATSSALARCLHWIGYLFFVQQRYGEAEPFWRDEVEKRQKLNNGDGQQRLNPKTLDAKSWLARCLGHLVGKQMEAKAIWEEVIGGWKELENVEKVAEAEVELQKVVGAGIATQKKVNDNDGLQRTRRLFALFGPYTADQCDPGATAQLLNIRLFKKRQSVLTSMDESERSSTHESFFPLGLLMLLYDLTLCGGIDEGDSEGDDGGEETEEETGACEALDDALGQTERLLAISG